MSEEPVGGYAAHAAPMQMGFYDGASFPAEYRNDAFVALHGSWNRRVPSGYEVLRLRFDAAGEFAGFEPFITGFLVPQPKRQSPLPGGQPYPAQGYIGRPTGIAVAADGSLLVGDDSNNALYRVTYAAHAPKLTPQKLAIEILRPSRAARISVTSTAFANGGRIPAIHSDYGKGISPPLAWSNAPAGTRSIVVMVEDPMATSPLPFVHWTAVLPANATSLNEGIPPRQDIAGMPRAYQGSNSRSEFGYFGPRPPAGDPPHDYHFQVFALDTTLELPSGFNRHALIQAMQGNVLASGRIIGKFSRQP
jgi:Raf kinase inhibitor-like YbhB/YbcL family protein